MEYWNNPKIQYSQTVLPYPLDTDPIRASSHSGKHVLFYDPGVHKARIRYNNTIQDQCDWLNNSDIWQDPFRVASVVKLNIYVEDIKRQGVVKPMLLYYDGNEKFTTVMKELLESEGVKVKNNIIIDFKNVIWDPSIELD